MKKAELRTPANAERICEMIAESWTLRQIGKEFECSPARIIDWVIEDEEFAKQYAHAKELMADRMADEIREISDDGSNDWMDREGMRAGDHEHIQRSKLRVDTRKWLMSKMMPKKYGEFKQVDQTITQTVTVSLEERHARSRKLLDEVFEEVVKPQPRPNHSDSERLH